MSIIEFLPVSAPSLRPSAPRRGSLWPTPPAAITLKGFTGNSETGLKLAPEQMFRTYAVKVSGSVVELVTTFVGQSRPVLAKRGEIQGFSGRSRRSLFKFCAALNWELLGPGVFITLTYPGEYSSDGLRVKKDLRALRSRLDRKFGSVQAVWKLEFQRRGAPHFHLALIRPEGVSTLELRDWIAGAWFEIVGSNDQRHLMAGTQVDDLQDNPAAYFAGYVGNSKGSKEYQHVVPENYENVGRFWGAWNLKPEWKTEALEPHEFVELRRLIESHAKSKRRPRADGSSFRSAYHKTTGRIQGQWYHARDLSALLLVRNSLSRALPRVLFTT